MVDRSASNPRQAPRRAPVLPSLHAPRLLDQVRERVRYLHYSLRTEQAYVHWIRAFVRFHGCRVHPREMGGAEVEAFLTWLAAERQVAASTHGQALSALLFLYQQVLGMDLPWMQSIGRPRRQPRLPTVLSQDEVARTLAHLAGTHRLLAQLLYGTGMRITEALQLRVKDLDFERRTLIVRCGKGGKDRALMLPEALVTPLREQMASGRLLWAADRQAGRACNFPMRWPASTRARRAHGRGSGSLRMTRSRATRAATFCAGITCTTKPFSVHSRRPLRAPVSRSRPRLTRCGIRLPREPVARYVALLEAA